MMDMDKLFYTNLYKYSPKGNPFRTIRLEDHLPEGFIAYIRTDPVIGFLHYKKYCTEDDEDIQKHKGDQIISMLYLTPDMRGGYNELIGPDAEIIGITPAPGYGKMYSLYVEGPDFKNRETLGYEFEGQTPIDWEAFALDILDTVSKAYNIYQAREAARDIGDAAGEEKRPGGHCKIRATMLDGRDGSITHLQDPQILTQLSKMLEDYIENREAGEGELHPGEEDVKKAGSGEEAVKKTRGRSKKE